MYGTIIIFCNILHFLFILVLHPFMKLTFLPTPAKEIDEFTTTHCGTPVYSSPYVLSVCVSCDVSNANIFSFCHVIFSFSPYTYYFHIERKYFIGVRFVCVRLSPDVSNAQSQHFLILLCYHSFSPYLLPHSLRQI